MYIQRILFVILIFSLGSCPILAMEQRWVDDLNARFPQLGDEFQRAVAQKLASYPPETSPDDLIARLTAHPEYATQQITNTETFGLHSELMVLYPAVGEYEKALQEAKLLRDFVIANPPDDPNVVVTFRGVYAELLIVNKWYDEALQECRKSQEIAPEEEGIYLSKGVVYTHLGDLEKVLENLGILTRSPDPQSYAQQLFDFLILHRHRFQKPQIQENTLIDVMLKDLAPEQGRTTIKIPAPTPLPTQSPVPTITPSPATITPSPSPTTLPAAPTSIATSTPKETVLLATLLAASQETQEQILGEPLTETISDTTLIQEYLYKGYTLTINRDKESYHILSCSMFFLPPVGEVEAFTHIGLPWRNIPPTLLTNSIKVWTPYDSFAKVRISLSQDDVLAIIVEP